MDPDFAAKDMELQQTLAAKKGMATVAKAKATTKTMAARGTGGRMDEDVDEVQGQHRDSDEDGYDYDDQGQPDGTPRWVRAALQQQQEQAGGSIGSGCGNTNTLLASSSLLPGNAGEAPSVADIVGFLVRRLHAENVTVLDVRARCSWTNFMIICEGTNEQHVQRIANGFLAAVWDKHRKVVVAMVALVVVLTHACSLLALSSLSLSFSLSRCLCSLPLLYNYMLSSAFILALYVC